MSDDGEHLNVFGAMRDATELLESGSANAEVGVAASRLIGYARRRDGLTDLAVERLLRQNPAARRIHDRALGGHALARSDMAMAAAGGTHVSRKVGAHRVELIEESEGVVYLVIYVAGEGVVPTAIEVRDTEGNGARLALGMPIGGIIQLRLDLSKPEPQQLGAALARTDSAVFLL